MGALNSDAVGHRILKSDFIGTSDQAVHQKAGTTLQSAHSFVLFFSPLFGTAAVPGFAQLDIYLIKDRCHLLDSKIR